MEPTAKPTRWWPLPLVLVIGAIAIVSVKTAEDTDQQAANIRAILIGIGAALLILIWLLAFSRLPRRKRLLSALAYVGVLALFFTGFRITGVSGNLVPIFEWRWAREATVLVVPDQLRRIEETPVPGLAPFPQFFGSERTGKLPGPKLVRDWTASPPEELWRRDVGEGWSGFAVAGRRAITQEQHGEDEAVVCYEILSGNVLWARKVQARFDVSVAGIGPRATPTVDGDRVFVVGSTGVFECLDIATGKPVWTKHILDDHEAELPDWGVACSPLVVGPVVVVSPGGPKGRSLVAYDKKTGDVAWRGGDERMHWSSPVRVSLAGQEQILIFNAAGLASHEIGSGDVLWSYPWHSKHPHVALPVVCSGNRVCISSGYGAGCHLLQIEKKPDGVFSATTVWRSLRLKAKFANFLEHDGFVYGLDDGVLTCIDVATGKRMWKRGRYGHGQLLLVDDLLLVMTEDGAIVLVETTPEEHREVTRFEVFGEKTWNPPALAGCYLVIRTERRAACLRLPVIK
jgi:outer membrane protein assembly factor BamB